MQLDFIGGLPPPKPFKDISNTRPSSAEEKARLCLELGALCRSVPEVVRNGSVNLTRSWLAAQKKGRALAANGRASAVDLGLAIKSLRSFEGS